MEVSEFREFGGLQMMLCKPFLFLANGLMVVVADNRRQSFTSP